jgi:predicted MFS family arabinose efflux permease
VLATRLLENDRGAGFGKGADIPGAVLITSSLMLAVYTIVKPAADDGWTAGTTLAFGAGALALLAAFVAREATAAEPLMPLRIFRSRNVTGSNLVQVLSVAGMFGMFFLGALYLQQVKRADALETGLAFLPVTVVMGTLSVRYSERLIMRFGARTLVIPGLAMIAVALVWLARLPVDGSYVVDFLPSMLLLGAGAGTCFPALMGLAMSGATPSDAGLASGLINTTAQVGGALGLAILATLAATRTDDLTAAGGTHAEALVGGYHLAFLVAAALVVAAIAVAAVVIKPAPAMDGVAEPEPERLRLRVQDELATEAA